MTTQTLIELVDSALSMQTQYSLRPSLYRIEAAKKAKTALLDALEAQAAELGYLRQALEHAINSTFTRKLDACQADCKILERERDELRAERAEFKSKLAVEAKAADHWMKEACKSHNLAVKLEAELAALKAQPTEPAPSMAGEREPLTLEKIADLNCVSIDRLDYDVFELDQESVIDFARAVEAAHGITQGEKV
jgi:uncharacterized coiled-coil DUF342 family protein